MIRVAEFFLQRLGVFQHKIEDALFVTLPPHATLIAFTIFAVAEEPLENQTRIRLRRQRRGLAFPSEIKLIRTTVTRIAIAGHSPPVTAKFQRGQPRFVANFLRGQLVHRDTHANIRPRRFARLATGQKSRIRPRMIARAVAIGPRLGVRQSAEN